MTVKIEDELYLILSTQSPNVVLDQVDFWVFVLVRLQPAAIEVVTSEVAP